VDDSYHMIFPNDRFYTETVAGVPFYEWVTALSNGVSVDSVGP